MSDASALRNGAEEATKRGHSLSRWHLQPPAQSWLQCPSPGEILTDGAAAGAWAAASGDFSSDQWYPHPDLSLPGWAFKPWDLLGDVLGSQHQLACANSSIAWHARCRKWTSVCE